MLNNEVDSFFNGELKEVKEKHKAVKEQMKTLENKIKEEEAKNPKTIESLRSLIKVEKNIRKQINSFEDLQSSFVAFSKPVGKSSLQNDKLK